jgi:hypothetical protein
MRCENMKMENGEIMEARSIEMKSGLAEPGHHKNHGFFIPAGILIGIGAGMLFDHAGAGFVIGLGLGLLSAGLFPLVRKSRDGETSSLKEADMTLLLIGAFIAFTGVCIVLAPVAFWPYAFAGFLILVGISFLVRGFISTSSP